ncbi:SDR family NAD(P)-dependent oxidoreductase [Mycobacteroides sp. LB1]|uniref:SDR family NAD(P)-dependent oxidoreductase n=1 Tax=Mycobacteroides sp. LB1 TaxID=2750814 RepID=UPI0015DD96EE|nr:SDR family NAD(P)-dependent oxidoreductase [Mycobacteroides sp. LB1]
MTGATGGLGAQAAKILAEQPDIRLIVGARGTGRSVPGAEVLPLDLVSLNSVRSFADAVSQLLGDTPIHALVLNAGLQFRDAQHRTEDGFETTFAANHLGHYLLARLLLPNIAEKGLLLITTSDTHDPAIIPFAPRALEPQKLAHPESGGAAAGFRAYAASKLCNLLTARSFAARADVTRRGIEVIAYNPGLTLGTSLAAPDSAAVRLISVGLRPAMRLISRFRPQFHPGTAERAGEALAELTLGAVAPPPGRIYVSLVKGDITFPDPAPLAQSDEARDRLWRESATMVGLEPA